MKKNQALNTELIKCINLNSFKFIFVFYQKNYAYNHELDFIILWIFSDRIGNIFFNVRDFLHITSIHEVNDLERLKLYCFIAKKINCYSPKVVLKSIKY